MVHHERLELGEKCFVSGIMAVLGLEALLTVITNGLHFSWIGVLLGVAGFCLILFLANRLYAGSRQAHKIALGWIGFQVLYAIFALYLLASSAQGQETARQIGAPVAWAVILKVLAYLSLGWVLVRMPTVRDFFAEKRGDIRMHESVAAAPALVTAETPAVPMELNPAQTEGARSLSKYLRQCVGGLITLGILFLLAGVAVFGLQTTAGLLVLGQGILILVLGLGLGGPSNDVRPLVNKEDQTRTQLQDALDSLSKYFKIQLAITVLLALLVAAQFYFLWQ